MYPVRFNIYVNRSVDVHKGKMGKKFILRADPLEGVPASPLIAALHKTFTHAGSLPHVPSRFMPFLLTLDMNVYAGYGALM